MNESLSLSIRHEEGFDLRILDFISFDDVFFCTAENCRGVFQINHAMQSVQRIISLPNENQLRLYRKILKWNDNIVVLPERANKILIWNINTRSTREINIPNGKVQTTRYSNGGGFRTGIIKNDFIYLVGAYPGIVKLNLLNGDVEIFGEWVEYAESIAKDKYYPYFTDLIELNNGCIIAPFRLAPYVAEIELNNIKLRWRHLQNIKYDYIVGAVVVNESVYVAPAFEKALVKYDLDFNFVDKYYYGSDNGKEPASNLITLFQGKIYILRQDKNAFNIFDPIKEEYTQEITIPGGDKRDCSAYTRFYCVNNVGDEIYAYSYALSQLICWDGEKLNQRQIKADCQYMWQDYSNQEKINESKEWSLNGFLNFVALKRKNSNIETSNLGVGENIYKRIIS